MAKQRFILALSTLLLLAGLNAHAEANSTGPMGPDGASKTSGFQQACHAAGSAQCLLDAAQRRHLVDDVYEYTIPVQVGPGEHDRIQLHRVLREAAPWTAAPTSKAVFMVHGDALAFQGAFLSSAQSTQVEKDHSIAVFLAQQGVDVWGLDKRWALVPAGTSDFSFMAPWGLNTNIADIRIGLSIARGVRRVSQGDLTRVALLGWSRGAIDGYAYLNDESLRPPTQRHVSAFIPVDMAFGFGPEAETERLWSCDRYEAAKAAQAQGQVEGGLLGPAPGVPVAMAGLAAAADPHGPAVMMPGWTNRQFALFLASATFAMSPTPLAVPYYHFTGAQFDANGLPTGLTWTREAYLFDYLAQAVPHQAFREIVDTETLLCGVLPTGEVLESPHDDHLADVNVPVLYLGAGGGFGAYGAYGAGRLGSTDVTIRSVSYFPDQARLLDYGHADLFVADNARQEVWQPLLEWLLAH